MYLSSDAVDALLKELSKVSAFGSRLLVMVRHLPIYVRPALRGLARQSVSAPVLQGYRFAAEAA
jgi:O-methyltransferase involved in polyketide biosynthesis